MIPVGKDLDFKDEDELITYCRNCNEIGAEWDDYCEICGGETEKFNPKDIKYVSSLYACPICDSKLHTSSVVVNGINTEPVESRFVYCPRCRETIVHYRVTAEDKK